MNAGGNHSSGVHLLFHRSSLTVPRPMAFLIVPSIDLRGGRVVRLKQGDYAQQLNYDVDPVATARSFREAGATWMHIVDLDGAKEGRPVQAVLVAKVIAASGVGVQAGGGGRR